MKKKTIAHLQLNKLSISNFDAENIKGQLQASDPIKVDFPSMIFYFNDNGECLCLSAEVF